MLHEHGNNYNFIVLCYGMGYKWEVPSSETTYDNEKWPNKVNAHSFWAVVNVTCQLQICCSGISSCSNNMEGCFEWCVIASALKSSPVSFILPFLEEPQTRPVPESFRMQEPWTRTTKNCKKLVVTGCNWSQNEYNKTCSISTKNRTLVVTISCSLTFYVNFKLLIVKISWELDILCYIFWNSKIWCPTFALFLFLLLFLSQFLPDLYKNYIKI